MLSGKWCLEIQPASQTPGECKVGTVFDGESRRCLSCPEGCLSCEDAYSCRVCSPDFEYDLVSALCVEHCGDGRRHTVECDDGNNANGDGCSESCRVEEGYRCVGGSPSTHDNCILHRPTRVGMSLAGEVRYSTSMVVNVKVDYLPPELLQSPDCNDRCSGVLDIEIVEGMRALNVRSMYLAGTSYDFAVRLEFGKPLVEEFVLEVEINRVIGQKYFRDIDTSRPLVIGIDPALLLAVEGDGPSD